MVREREAVVDDPGVKVFVCPECPERLLSLEALGQHLERHREITAPAAPSKRGRPKSRPCPKNCGRFFPLIGNNEDWKSHTALCDGSEPIVIVPEEPAERMEGGMAIVADRTCDKCGKEFKFPSYMKTHRKRCGGGADAAEPDSPPSKETARLTITESSTAIATQESQSVKDVILGTLEKMEEHFTEQLRMVKRLIVAVRGVEDGE